MGHGLGQIQRTLLEQLRARRDEQLGGVTARYAAGWVFGSPPTTRNVQSTRRALTALVGRHEVVVTSHFNADTYRPYLVYEISSRW